MRLAGDSVVVAVHLGPVTRLSRIERGNPRRSRLVATGIIGAGHRPVLAYEISETAVPRRIEAIWAEPPLLLSRPMARPAPTAPARTLAAKSRQVLRCCSR